MDKRFAIIDGGAVVNAVMAPTAEAALGGAIDLRAVEHSSASAGWTFAAPASFTPPALTSADLIVARASLAATIDNEAERQRLRWITGGAGQAMTYARKVEEARLVEANVDPKPDDYPMLAASIGIDGVDLAAVAATILAMDAAWGRIGGAIEARRLGLKRDVGQAASLDDLALIDITTGWPE